MTPNDKVGAEDRSPRLGMTAPSAPGDVRPAPRLRCVDRQRMLPAMPLEDLLEPDHPARRVWDYVQQLDLSLLYQRIGSRLGGPGHPAADPRILVALWLCATLTGVVSARRLDDLVA
jgi:hypothetical protein